MKIAPILFLFASSESAYQGPLPPAPSGPPPPGLPIDGFVIFLFLFGIMYGVKKRYDFIKSKKLA
jgi:hypothetical protein